MRHYENTTQFYVYKHTAPNGKVYIGITSQTPKERWGGGKSGYRGNKYFLNAINRYGWENIKHEVLFECLTKEQAERIERELIAEYKSNQREYGYNIQNGGNSHGKHSNETKMLIGIKAKGKTHTMPENARQKLRDQRKGSGNPMYGKHFSESHKNKLSIALKGKNKGLFLGEKSARARKVFQYDRLGNLVKEYGSLSDAQRELNIDYGSIVKVCLGQRKTAGGFVWRYANEAL